MKMNTTILSRTIVAAACLLMACIVSHAQAQQRVTRDPFSPAALLVEPASLHLGDVRPGESVTRSVVLRNDADRELVLLRTATSCACAVPDLGGRKVLAPGETLELPITYTGFDAHFGETGQQVVVFVEGFSIPTQIAVHANINHGIRPTVEYTPPRQYRDADVTLESVDGRPFRIESVNLQPPVYLDGFDPATDEPRSRYTIAQRFGELAAEEIPPYLLIVTDDPQSPVLSLRVTNLEWEPPRVPRDFFIQAEPVVMGALPAAGVTEVEVQLLGVRMDGPVAAHDLLDWFEARSDNAAVSLLGVRAEPDKGQAFLRIGVRPFPTHRGHIMVQVWATIGEHTEYTVLHGRVFPPEEMNAEAPDAPGGN
jgi:hypothetical protein